MSLENKRQDPNWLRKWLCWLLSRLPTVPPPIHLIFPSARLKHTYNHGTKCSCSVSRFSLFHLFSRAEQRNSAMFSHWQLVKLHFNDSFYCRMSDTGCITTRRTYVLQQFTTPFSGVSHIRISTWAAACAVHFIQLKKEKKIIPALSPGTLYLSDLYFCNFSSFFTIYFAYLYTVLSQCNTINLGPNAT